MALSWGPVIELGFYWSGGHQSNAFRRVFLWLLSRGYRVASPVRVVRGSGPSARFDHVGIEDAPRGDFFASSEWIPMGAHLTPTDEDDVEIEMEYGSFDPRSLRADDPHVIEIGASGYYMTDMENAIASGDKDVLRIEKWRKRFFREVCEHLSPEYASLGCEWSLEPPVSLVRFSNIWLLADFYLSKDIASASTLEAQFRPPGWNFERFLNGVFMSQPIPHVCTRDETCEGTAVIQSHLRKHYF